MKKQVVGVYNNAEKAVRVVERLRSQGYSKDDISLAANDEVRQSIPYGYEGNVEQTHTSAQANDRSFWEQVKDAFSFEETDHTTERTAGDPLYGYEEDLQRGHIAVLVNSDQDVVLTEEAGYAGVEADRDLTEDEKIQLREERLNVDKQNVQTGEVRVKKDVVEETETVEVPTTHEEVTIERKPVNRKVTDGEVGNTLSEDEEIVIPVHEEQVTVDKENVVTEEVEIKREDVTEDKRVTDTVKREEIDVDAEGDIDVEK